MYGEKIQAIRMARGYSQQYMAQQLGIRQEEYSRIETNQKKLQDEGLLAQIAEALGVGVHDIKSPTPIIMRFSHSQYNGQNGTMHQQTNEKIIEELTAQLKVKDEQISRLLQLVAGSNLQSAAV